MTVPLLLYGATSLLVGPCKSMQASSSRNMGARIGQIWPRGLVDPLAQHPEAAELLTMKSYPIMLHFVGSASKKCRKVSPIHKFGHNC